MKPILGYFLFVIVLIALAILPITAPLTYAIATIFEYGIYILVVGVPVLIVVCEIVVAIHDRRNT